MKNKRINAIISFIKCYDAPFGLVFFVPLVLFIIFKMTNQTDVKEPGLPTQSPISMVEVDCSLFKEALSDSCELKGSKLKFLCSENLMNRVMEGVDTNAAKIVDNKIELEKNGGYIKIPARMMVNLFDNNLLNTSLPENQEN